MKVVWRTGRGTTTFNSGNSKLAQKISEDLTAQIFQQQFPQTVKNLRELVKILHREVDADFERMMPFITRSLFNIDGRSDKVITPEILSKGTGIGRGTQKSRVTGGVFWPKLSLNTIAQKMDRAGSSFFSDKGDLKRFFQSGSLSLISRVGRTRFTILDDANKKVDLRRKGNKVHLATLVIHIAPNVTPNLLPSLRTGNIGSVDPNMGLEKLLGVPQAVLSKLKGPKNGTMTGHQRPLMQPVMAYWIRDRIPNLITGRVITATDRFVRRATKANAKRGD